MLMAGWCVIESKEFKLLENKWVIIPHDHKKKMGRSKFNAFALCEVAVQLVHESYSDMYITKLSDVEACKTLTNKQTTREYK